LMRYFYSVAVYNNGIKGDGKKPPRLMPDVGCQKSMIIHKYYALSAA
jgi:hypothetical protein